MRVRGVNMTNFRKIEIDGFYIMELKVLPNEKEDKYVIK